MLAVTEPGVEVLTCMVSTQLLKTALLENIFGYHAHLDPCPILLVQPKEDAAEAFSKERIAPMVRVTPALKALVGHRHTRKSEDTLLYKAFPGGFLALVGAGSPDNLARRPIRLTLYDEVDKYPVTKEGDPFALGDERQATFSNALSVRVCSPTLAGESRIEFELPGRGSAPRVGRVPALPSPPVPELAARPVGEGRGRGLREGPQARDRAGILRGVRHRLERGRTPEGARHDPLAPVAIVHLLRRAPNPARKLRRLAPGRRDGSSRAGLGLVAGPALGRLPRQVPLLRNLGRP